MTAPPTGTVTLLMTDIEGSTRRWEEQGERFIPVLLAHNELIRGTLNGLDGYEVKTEGDSFFYAFSSAGKAVEGALRVQLALDHDQVAVRVRIGIHTGEPTCRGTEYFGPAVNRTDRVRDAAHGGQILISQATQALVASDLPEDAALWDRGEHRLRDLGSPERLYQLIHPDLQREFPPLRTLEAQPNNLPAQPTSFVGRKQERLALSAILTNRSARLITLTGPGGVGKTRLALQVAVERLDEFPDGVWFVQLASAEDGQQVVALIASAVLGEAAEHRGGTPLSALIDFFRDKRALLLLDSFDKAISAASVVGDLLASLPRVSCLVTSRALLHVSGEHEFQVPSLTTDESMQLFLERAQAAKPGMQLDRESRRAVIQICDKLDGLPLAIELAAARLRGMTAQQVAGRLEKRFDLLSGGGRDLPDRQRTMRAALDWSYEPLEPDEKSLFAQLSVFEGGFFLDAAEEICEDVDVLEGIFNLRDHSLLTAQEILGESRYQMLTMVREYAATKLADAEPLRRRHADHYLRLAQELGTRLNGPEQRAALVRLDVEIANVEAAIRWTDESGSHKQFAAFVSALGEYAHTRGLITPAALDMVRRAVDGLKGSDDTESLATLLQALGAIAWLRGDLGEAEVLLTTSLKYNRALNRHTASCHALNLLAWIAADQGRYDQARTRLLEGVETCDGAGLQRERALLVQNLSAFAYRSGDLDESAQRAEECLTLNRKMGDEVGAAYPQHTLGLLAWKRGERGVASRKMRDSLNIWRENHDQPGIARAIRDVGTILLEENDLEDGPALILAAHSLESHRHLTSTLEDRAAIQALHSRLGEQEIARIMAEVEGMSPDDMLARAVTRLENLV